MHVQEEDLHRSWERSMMGRGAVGSWGALLLRAGLGEHICLVGWSSQHLTKLRRQVWCEEGEVQAEYLLWGLTDSREGWDLRGQ